MKHPCMTIALLSLITLLFQRGLCQQYPRRQIDRCAQDGLFFYPMDDSIFGKGDSRLGGTVTVARYGVEINLRYPAFSSDAVITYSRDGHSVRSNVKDFDAALGWLTVSKHAFAVSLSPNAFAYSTQLFEEDAAGGPLEELTLVPKAQQIFVRDAKRVCSTPGSNTTAIKWIDDDHLLIAINAWSSGFCSSNFTEGFVLQLSTNTIQRRMSEGALINLPAICTWNIVPSIKH